MKQCVRDSLEKLEQLESKEARRQASAKRTYEKQIERLCFILGRLFLEAFPECRQLRPQLTAQGDELEFKSVRDFLSAVAAERRPKLNSER